MYLYTRLSTVTVVSVDFVLLQELKLCEIDAEVLEKLKKFRFRKERTTAAIISECSITKHKVTYFYSISAC